MGASVIPVIAIDGPSASGKGTIAAAVAQHLGFHYLDSGALYRIVGLVAGERRANLDSDSEISHIALNLNIKFNGEAVWVDGRDVSALIRGEVAGAAASRVAALPGVRTALMTLQRSFRLAPAHANPTSAVPHRCRRSGSSRQLPPSGPNAADVGREAWPVCGKFCELSGLGMRAARRGLVNITFPERQPEKKLEVKDGDTMARAQKQQK